MTTTTQRAVRLPGVLLVLAGAALVLASFRFLDWYEISTRNVADSAGNVTFSSLHSSADQLGGAGSASVYFGWLAWLLLIAVILTGVGANLPFGPADPLRVAGFVLAVIGVATTYLAVAQLHNAQVAAGAQKHSVFHNSTWGLWTAFAGFLLAAAGAALGPRSVTR